MTKENEKIEIDDIKEPDSDLDIEEAISESDSEKDIKDKTVLEKTEEEKEESDVLEKAVMESNSDITDSENENQKVKKKLNFNWKIFFVVIITALVTAAIILGVVYFLNRKNNDLELSVQQPETKTEEPKNLEDATKESKLVYVTSELGLNLREEPALTAKILVTIPFGTKLTILEEKSGWYKTEYSSKTGWISKDYTSTKNPFVYENIEYGFQLTFPEAWAGYKIFKKESANLVSLYVALPTNDKNWSESEPIEKGYASLFAVGIYTKENWEKVKNEDGPKPTYLGEIKGYSITYTSGQATPADLEDRFPEIKSIINTYKAL